MHRSAVQESQLLKKDKRAAISVLTIPINHFLALAIASSVTALSTSTALFVAFPTPAVAAHSSTSQPAIVNCALFPRTLTMPHEPVCLVQRTLMGSSFLFMT